MADTDAMDPAALDRLDRLGAAGFANRIIGIFLTEVPRRLEEAGRALGTRDSDGLAHAVHALDQPVTAETLAQALAAALPAG